MSDKKNLEPVKDTGHNWDGITELDNPPPRWWLNALYLSGLLVLVYFILYPSIPFVKDSSEGLLGWTQMSEYKQQMAEIEQIRAPYEQKLSEMTAEEILQDKGLLGYVMTTTKVLYGDNCAGCHGVGGQPQPGMAYPVLADDDWLFGGSMNEIMMSIANGRVGYMPGHTDMVNDQELEQLTQFVMQGADAVKNPQGMALFIEKDCISCHGDNAQGDVLAGSANLTDSIWRFSNDKEQIKSVIMHGVNDETDPKTRMAVMPRWNEKVAVKLEILIDILSVGEDITQINWDDELSGEETERLSENDIKKLTIYVHQMGGGQ